MSSHNSEDNSKSITEKSIIDKIKGWEGDEPSFDEFYFSTWITWLLLVLVYRKLFGIKSDITAAFKLILVQYFASLSFVVDKYFKNAPENIGDYLLYGYFFIVVIIFWYLLISPIFRYPYARQNLPQCMANNMCGLVIGLILFSIFYTLSHAICAGFAEFLTEGSILDGRHKILNKGYIPPIILVIISTIAWAYIIYKAGTNFVTTYSRQSGRNYDSIYNFDHIQDTTDYVQMSDR